VTLVLRQSGRLRPAALCVLLTIAYEILHLNYARTPTVSEPWNCDKRSPSIMAERSV
jgi:hypothetical protein